MEKAKIERKIVLQLLIIFGIIFLFLLTGFYYQVCVDGNYINRAGIQVGLVGIIEIILFFLSIKSKDKIKRKLSILIKNNKFLFFVVIIVILPRIFMLGSQQRWDALEYYGRLTKACADFDFSISGYITKFCLCNHPTLGLSLFTAIGEFLNPAGTIAVQIITLILTVLAFVCIYDMFMNYWMNMSKKEAAICTTICSFIPVVLGTYTYFNPDYYLAIFTIFMIYSLSKNWYILYIFSGWLVTQTKETGLVIVAALFIYVFILNWINTQGNFKGHIKSSFRYLFNFCALIIVALECIYMFIVGGISKWNISGNEKSTISNVVSTNIDWDSGYVIMKLKQLFLMNFSWIVFLVIIFFLILNYFNSKKGKKRKISITSRKIQNICGLLFIMLGYLFFSLFYITFTLYRYNIIWALFSVIICMCVSVEMCRIIDKKLLSMICAGVMGVLFLVQTFYSIDFISNKVFEKRTTGKTNILFTSYNSSYYGDGLVYNYQYTWIDRVLDKMLMEVDYTTDMSIFTSDLSWHIDGNSFAGIYLFWDKDRQKRTFVSQNTDGITSVIYGFKNVFGVGLDAIDEKVVVDKNNYKNYYPERILLPYVEQVNNTGIYFDMLNLIDKYYFLDYDGEVETYGGELKYEMYVLKKKSDILD